MLPIAIALIFGIKTGDFAHAAPLSFAMAFYWV
jgi:hypothetical protein